MAFKDFSRTPQDRHTRDYSKNYGTSPRPLSPEQILNLFYTYKLQGSLQARDTILKANMNAIISMVCKNYNYPEIPTEDLIQQAVIGFCKGLDEFEVGRGKMQPATYAIQIAKRGVNIWLEENLRTVRLPKNCYRAAAEYRRNVNEKIQEYETTSIPPDMVASDRYNYRSYQNGAMQSTMRNVTTSEPNETFDDIPDHNNGPRDSDQQRILLTVYKLSDPAKTLLLSFYELNEEPYKDACQRLGYKRATADGLISEAINRIRVELRTGNAKNGPRDCIIPDERKQGAPGESMVASIQLDLL